MAYYELISKIIYYLNDPNNSRWVTSNTLINKLNLPQISPLDLDNILVRYFQDNPDSEIRFSTLPSRISLDVLWGSVERIKKRGVSDIYRQDELILIEELDRTETKNMFLSHSFRDSEIVIKLAKRLMDYKIYPWLAETEILKRSHINQSVKEAIEKLPYFGVFISENLVNSVWSAKEIDFALRNEKEIVGIIYSKNIDFVHTILEPLTSGGTKVSREIFRRFFDSHLRVKFLFYPQYSDGLVSNWKNKEHVVDWDYLNTYS